MSSSRGDDRRDEVLRAAIDVFGESGFSGSRIDDVAQRVGIRRPSVLYHFPDKSALYRAALARVVEEITQRVVATESLTEGRLDAIVETWVDFVVDHPWAARLMLRQMIDETPGLGPDETLGPVATLLASLQRALDEHAPGARAEASEFALVLSSTTLVWAGSSRAVQEALGLRTLEPAAVARHRETLRALVRQLGSTAGASGRSQAAVSPETRRPDPGSNAVPEAPSGPASGLRSGADPVPPVHARPAARRTRS
ncbi:MAG: TetR/AcrR family transcriptional regulator [Myxococcota bacterium]